jgi:hypothetical protein
MKYTPETCPKCGTPVDPPASDGGRPTRWCCEGCKRSGEAEMARLQSLLRRFELGRGVERLSGNTSSARQAVIAQMQARYDHLAGVPAVQR